MNRLWRPVLVGAVIVVATFALAQAQIFEPDAPSPPPGGLLGNAVRGEAVFEDSCAGCHGEGGAGGSGPRLIGTGLDAETVATTIEVGSRSMPSGIVSGQDQVDVMAYVVSISSP